MRSRGLSLALTALCTMAALSACSSDDSDGDEPKSGGSESSASESPTIYPVDGCQAKVGISGALQVKWSGNAMATPSGDATTYQASNNKSSWVAVTTAAGDAPAQVVVTVKGTTYDVPDKSVTVKESADGLTATASAEVSKGKMAKVQAKFTCEKTAG